MTKKRVVIGNDLRKLIPQILEKYKGQLISDQLIANMDNDITDRLRKFYKIGLIKRIDDITAVISPELIFSSQVVAFLPLLFSDPNIEMLDIFYGDQYMFTVKYNGLADSSNVGRGSVVLGYITEVFNRNGIKVIEDK